jgi:hypothetical protein
VTYEHEYILIFRKGEKRLFSSARDRLRRQQSAFFWEERNLWFSDLWSDLRGMSQNMADPESRGRSAAFPFELPFRLIQMYSLIGDTVLDPFLGTGTTGLAAAASARNSIGLEIDASLKNAARHAMDGIVALGQDRTRARLDGHRTFVKERTLAGKPPQHFNEQYGFPVTTRQEENMILTVPVEILQIDDLVFEVRHERASPELHGWRQAEFQMPGMQEG